eukprot:TRINITY_DN5227_c0_g1_i1.p1 TRINITY_DN5227_c0_g1~~TRINITY_DN5227_c0_g1_i1.p1  ORF type:complete len:852 (-),score=125.80 TRINITY_DN5227_c0_g1_i1:136-2691(-)
MSGGKQVAAAHPAAHSNDRDIEDDDLLSGSSLELPTTELDDYDDDDLGELEMEDSSPPRLTAVPADKQNKHSNPSVENGGTSGKNHHHHNQTQLSANTNPVVRATSPPAPIRIDHTATGTAGNDHVSHSKHQPTPHQQYQQLQSPGAQSQASLTLSDSTTAQSTHDTNANASASVLLESTIVATGNGITNENEYAELDVDLDATALSENDVSVSQQQSPVSERPSEPAQASPPRPTAAKPNPLLGDNKGEREPRKGSDSSFTLAFAANQRGARVRSGSSERTTQTAAAGASHTASKHNGAPPLRVVAPNSQHQQRGDRPTTPPKRHGGKHQPGGTEEAEREAEGDMISSLSPLSDDAAPPQLSPVLPHSRSVADASEVLEEPRVQQLVELLDRAMAQILQERARSKSLEEENEALRTASMNADTVPAQQSKGRRSTSPRGPADSGRRSPNFNPDERRHSGESRADQLEQLERQNHSLRRQNQMLTEQVLKYHKLRQRYRETLLENRLAVEQVAMLRLRCIDLQMTIERSAPNSTSKTSRNSGSGSSSPRGVDNSNDRRASAPVQTPRESRDRDTATSGKQPPVAPHTPPASTPRSASPMGFHTAAALGMNLGLSSVRAPTPPRARSPPVGHHGGPGQSRASLTSVTSASRTPPSVRRPSPSRGFEGIGGMPSIPGVRPFVPNSGAAVDSDLGGTGQGQQLLVQRMLRALSPRPTPAQLAPVIDQMVHELRRDLAHNQGIRQLPLHRCGPCVYQLAGRRLTLALLGDRLAVRLGGGLQDFAEYLRKTKYGQSALVAGAIPSQPPSSIATLSVGAVLKGEIHAGNTSGSLALGGGTGNGGMAFAASLRNGGAL